MTHYEKITVLSTDGNDIVSFIDAVKKCSSKVVVKSAPDELPVEKILTVDGNEISLKYGFESGTFAIDKFVSAKKDSDLMFILLDCSEDEDRNFYCLYLPWNREINSLFIINGIERYGADPGNWKGFLEERCKCPILFFSDEEQTLINVRTGEEENLKDLLML